MIDIIAQKYGFTIKKQHELTEIVGEGYIFEHIQSGAELFYIKSDDENKVFSIAFKTPPTDDCGTPHIVEHSIFCGSKKYQAKDPFNELAKGSLNTYLNALTYADKTVYPIASCNNQDFHNLMDVYLDGVFHPNIYDKKPIFMQEGWRYLYDQNANSLDITGVVYNEMKGVFSDPESLLSSTIARSMFGETTYGFESGGHPDAIPELTYEDFLDFHKTHYHPSNSHIYLYGNMDLDECLAHLCEYLKDYNRITALPTIVASDFIPKNEIVYKTYPTSEEEELGNGYLAYNFKVGKCTDAKRVLAIQILSSVLLESNSSKLKIALQEAGICDEVEGWFDSSTYEMVFSIVGKNASSANVDAFIRTIEDALMDTAKNGPDKELLNSTLKRLEFLLREEDYGTTPKGLIYGLKSLKTLLHGEEPFQSLNPLATLAELKSDDQIWKTLAEEMKNEPAKTTVVFMPEIGKGSSADAAFKERLAREASSLAPAQKEQLLQEKKELDEFQNQEDSIDILEQIPLLELSQITRKADYTECLHTTCDNIPLHFVPLTSNGVIYAKLQFSIEHLPAELLPYAGILAKIMGKLDTEKYSYSELPIVLQNAFGGVSFRNRIYSQSADACRAFFSLNFKVLESDFGETIPIIEEILLHTNYENKDNLLKLLKMEMLNGESALINHAHLEAVHYSCGCISRGSFIDETTDGISFYHFLKDIINHYEENSVETIAQLQKVAQLIFNRENLEISMGGADKSKSEFETQLSNFIKLLPSNSIESHKKTTVFTPKERAVAFQTSGSVQYNIQAFDFNKLGIPYHGSMQVLRTITNLEFLWNNIRVQGGAYGCGCNLLRSGIGYFYSYRDPNLGETYQIYKKLEAFLNDFTADERQMRKYILGTINQLDQPKTSKERFDEAIHQFYREINYEMIQEQRNQILDTTIEELQGFGQLFNQIAITNNICTIGSQNKIQEQNHLFDSIQNLIP